MLSSRPNKASDTPSTALLNEWAGCGRLDKAPAGRCYIDLPEDFGRRFVIFIDTEEEFDWSGPIRREQRSTKAMQAMPAMHDRLRAAGVKPVYLIDHPIVTDPASVEILRKFHDAGECTIGTQLHPWVNPPFDEEVTPYNSFTGNLPISLQREKLKNLTEEIAQAFGARPTVYRAGRYGVGRDTAALLIEAGYRVDVSVRALFDYSNANGPDFAHVEPRPYWVGDGQLLEVPLSAAFTGRLRRAGRRLYPLSARVPGLRSALTRAGMLARIALTPEDMPLGQVKEAIRNLLADGVRLLSISFHSPSVQPGHTPYVRTEDDLGRFYAWWDGLFEFLAARNVAPASIEDILEAATAARQRR